MCNGQNWKMSIYISFITQLHFWQAYIWGQAWCSSHTATPCSNLLILTRHTKKLSKLTCNTIRMTNNTETSKALIGKWQMLQGKECGCIRCGFDRKLGKQRESKLNGCFVYNFQWLCFYLVSIKILKKLIFFNLNLVLSLQSLDI